MATFKFRQLKFDFWSAEYEDVSIVFMKEYDYFNVNHLLASTGKYFDDWYDANHDVVDDINEKINNWYPGFTHTFWSMEEVHLSDIRDKSEAGIDIYFFGDNIEVSLLKVKTKGRTDIDKQIAGMYCHKKLLPAVSHWANEKYAEKIDSILNHAFVNVKTFCYSPLSLV